MPDASKSSDASLPSIPARTTTGRTLHLQEVPEHPGVFRDAASGTHYRYDGIRSNEGGAEIIPPDWLIDLARKKYDRVLHFETVEFTYVEFDEHGRLDTTVHGNEQHWATYHRIRLSGDVLLTGVRLSTMITAVLTRHFRPICIVPLDAEPDEEQVHGFSNWVVVVNGVFPIRVDITSPTMRAGPIRTIDAEDVDWPASVGLANDRLEAALARELARGREGTHERIRSWIEAADANATRVHLDALSLAP